MAHVIDRGSLKSSTGGQFAGSDRRSKGGTLGGGDAPPSTRSGGTTMSTRRGLSRPPSRKPQLAKVVYSSSVGKPWQSEIKPDSRRKINLDKKKKGKKP